MSDEKKLEKKRRINFIKNVMGTIDGFETTRNMTELFVDEKYVSISSGSIISSSLSKEMQKEKSAPGTLKRYLDVPFEGWNLNFFYFLWEQINDGNYLSEEEFFVKREGEIIALIPIWEFLLKVINGEIETSPFIDYWWQKFLIIFNLKKVRPRVALIFSKIISKLNRFF